MDNLDIKLIKELMRDGRRDYLDLSKQLRVSDGTIRTRVKRLVAKNIIKIVAVPNLQNIGYKFTCIVGLQVEILKMKEIAYKLAQDPHVCFLSFVTGKFDLIAMIVCENADEYARIWSEKISTIPGVQRTEAFLNLKIIKGSEGLLDITEIIDFF